MVAQLSVPGQSPGLSSGSDRLQPFSYTHSNTSKTSNMSIGVCSTFTTHRGTHLDVARHRPEARSNERAAARGISRVASRAPSQHSRATSRSRSRAPGSPSPIVVPSELPTATISPPGDFERYTCDSSHHTLAIPNGETAPVTPESLPQISISLLQEDRLWPVLTIPRYDDYPTITVDRADWNLRPMTLSYSTEGVPSDWIACVHPEGRLYFYHPGKRLYTDADVRDRTMIIILEAFEDTLREMITSQGIILPPDHELVLHLEERKISGGYNWLYYYVNHETRSLFWVQEFDIIEQLEMTRGIHTLSDIRWEIEAKYWLHCEMYPYRHEVQEEVFTELSGMLVFASIDIITSMTSTVVYKADDVHRMLGLVKSAKAVAKTEYATVVVARLMHLFLHQRFLNFYGQTYARLGRDQSVYNSVRHPRTPLITFLAPLFWNAPEVHLRGLEKIWTDNVIAIQPWSSFISKLQVEWQEFVLYATVLLNANVAFLAIPSVDNGSGKLTAPQISSYLSIITSVGSILLGLLLIRQHRVKSKDTAEEAWRYLSSRKHPTLGLETLSIIYSLPYALLMWGMVTFLLAFSFQTFGTPDRVGVFTTAAGWIAVAILVCWCVFTGWESNEISIWDRFHQWQSLLFPEKEENTQTASTHAVSEKATSNWMGRMLRHVRFSHSNDPPPEMEERPSSTV
ncbi:hypothetical protein C8Q73DRAFT_638403 [Cubamyces lactineus]|nr:hypothetical protein C8Q73DRAFT_638403 [Cubamyces lactineus]